MEHVPVGGKTHIRELSNNRGTITKESDGYTVYLHLKQGEEQEEEFYTYFNRCEDAVEYLDNVFAAIEKSLGE